MPPHTHTTPGPEILALPAHRDEAQTLAIELAMTGTLESEIARRTGYSIPTICVWLGEARAAGIPLPPSTATTGPKPNARRDEARRLRAKGHSIPELAKLLEAPEKTIYRWLESDPSLPVPPAALEAAEAPAELEQPPDLEADGAEALDVTPQALLVRLNRQLVDMDRRAKAAERDGMHSVAQRYTRDSIGLAASVERLEARLGASKDGVKVSKAEIAEAWDRVLTMVHAITARPLLCSHCSRELSITLAGRDTLEP